jgi:hypothetical protein
LVLALTWASLMVATVVVGQRESSLPELEAQVQRGDVTQVRISEGLAPGETGSATVRVAWRDGLVNHYAEVTETRHHSGGQVELRGRPGSGTSQGDLRSHLHATDPDLRFESAPFIGESTNLAGWEAPGAYANAFLVLTVATLLLLLARPGPTWRATRWAWFWMLGLGPVGAPACLLLGGPCAGVRPPRADGARLTGGWAFLIVAVVSWAFDNI